MQGSPHAEGMVMAYLPKEKILIEADVYTPPARVRRCRPSSGRRVNLYDNIKGYKLDVATVVGLHGRAVPWAEFLRFVQKPN
jgi:hypothetical protein